MNSITLSGTVETPKINIRKLPDKTPITSFVLRVKKENACPTDKSKYEFITIVCWNQMATYAAKNFTKGTVVSVRGSLHVGKRTLKDYEVFKDGELLPDFQIPFCEINAEHVEKM